MPAAEKVSGKLNWFRGEGGGQCSKRFVLQLSIVGWVALSVDKVRFQAGKVDYELPLHVAQSPSWTVSGH